MIFIDARTEIATVSRYWFGSLYDDKKGTDQIIFVRAWISIIDSAGVCLCCRCTTYAISYVPREKRFPKTTFVMRDDDTNGSHSRRIVCTYTYVYIYILVHYAQRRYKCLKRSSTLPGRPHRPAASHHRIYIYILHYVYRKRDNAPIFKVFEGLYIARSVLFICRYNVFIYKIHSIRRRSGERNDFCSIRCFSNFFEIVFQLNVEFFFFFCMLIFEVDAFLI